MAAFIALFTVYYLLRGSFISPDPVSENRFFLLTGDEPHYLLIAHSIAMDGDINLTNNKRQKDYRSFYNKLLSGYTKHQEFWLRYVKGDLRSAPSEYWKTRGLSVLPVGMPALVSPVYRAAHALNLSVRYCVVLFFQILAAAIVLMMIDLSWMITRARAYSLFAAGCMAFSAPLIFYTARIFPGLPGAFSVVLGVWLLAKLERSDSFRRTTFLMISIMLVSAFIPWIHARLIPEATILLLFTGILIRRQPRKRLRLAGIGLGAFMIGIIPLALYYYHLFGVPYPVSTHPPISLLVGIKTGWLGRLFDRNNGLLWYTPMVAFALPGLWYMCKKKVLIGKLTTMLFLSNWIFVGLFSDWRGGLCPPLRYWLPVFPLVTLPFACSLKQANRLWVKVFGVLLGLFGVIIGVASMLEPNRMYKYAHPVLPYWFNKVFYRIAPKLFPEATTGDYLRSGLLLLALVSFVAAFIVFGFRTRQPIISNDND